MLVEDAPPMSTTPALPESWTLERYFALPEDGRRFELWDGVLVAMTTPIPLHQRLSMGLSLALGLWCRTQAGAQVYAAPLSVVLRAKPPLVVQPDLLVLLPGSRAKVGPKAIEGGPDLVVEILSPSTGGRDRVAKRRAYAQAGVRAYWIVDPGAQVVECQALEASGAWGPVAAFDRAEVLADPLLPGFALPLAELFPEALDDDAI